MPVKARIPVPLPERLRVTGFGVVVVDTDVVVVVGGLVVVVVVVGGGVVVVVVGGLVVVVVDTDVVVVVGGLVVVVVGGVVVVDTDVVVVGGLVVVVVGGLVVVVVVGLVVVVVGGLVVVVVVGGLVVVVVVVGEHKGVRTVVGLPTRAQAWPDVPSRRPRSRTTTPTRANPRPIRRIRLGSPWAFVPGSITTLPLSSSPGLGIRAETKQSRRSQLHDSSAKGVANTCQSKAKRRPMTSRQRPLQSGVAPSRGLPSQAIVLSSTAGRALTGRPGSRLLRDYEGVALAIGSSVGDLRAITLE